MFSFFGNNSNANYEKLAYDFNFNKINGAKLNLKDFKGKVIVIINVASQCGFTNQYTDMQKIWGKYQEKNFVIIGIPSNEFGKQEPGSNEQIKKFCESKFSISFPMVEKVSVKGDNAHPFYIWAKKNFGKSAVPKWNFHKIIIDKNGKVARTFSSITNPSSKKFTNTIEELL
jgi:glutathione peroxidase